MNPLQPAQDQVLGDVLIDKPSWHAMPGGFCISRGSFCGTA